MKAMMWVAAGSVLFIGVLGNGGVADAQVSKPGQGNWVRVGNGSMVPQDLSIGDQVELSIGSVVEGRGAIVGSADCGGQRTYYTSSRQTGCGWSNSITAYARSSTETGAQATATTALEVPQ